MIKKGLLFSLISSFLYANSDYNLNAILWQQRSAEYQALCQQVFNMAKSSLDKTIEGCKQNKSKNKKPLAVVVSVDEGVLTHNKFAARLIKESAPFSEEDWGLWHASKESTPTKGALEFTKYAKSKSVEVFYITNTVKEFAKDLMDHMKKLGFPNIEDKYFFPRTAEKDKANRMGIILKDYKVAVYIGDQLSDFPGFKATKEKEREKELNKNKDKFGTEFFLLPNITYGSWMSALGESPSKKLLDAWKKPKKETSKK